MPLGHYSGRDEPTCFFDGFDAERPDSIGTGQLVRTPPAGWNRWNAFACEAIAKKIRTAADEMEETRDVVGPHDVPARVGPP